MYCVVCVVLGLCFVGVFDVLCVNRCLRVWFVLVLVRLCLLCAFAVLLFVVDCSFVFYLVDVVECVAYCCVFRLFYFERCCWLK